MHEIFNGRVAVIGLVILVVLALAGSCVAGMSESYGRAQQARIEMQAEQERLDRELARREKAERADLDRFLWFARYALGTIIVFSAIVAVVLVGSVYGLRKAATIAPDERGLFPFLLGRSGGAWVVLDPNRQIASVTTVGSGQVPVNHHLQDGLELAQVTVTSQAQRVQLEAARASAWRNVQVQGNTPALTPQVQADQVMNNWPHTVPLRGLLQAQGGSTLDSIILGMTLDEYGQQRVVSDSLVNLSHVGIGGSSGWGKTRCCESLLYQLITAREQPAVAVIDLKRELAHFSRSERLLWPVATSASDGAVIFHELVRELHKRLELFESVGGCRGLADYNSRRNGNPALSPICLLADESTLLLKNGDKQLVSGIQELALSGRSAGLLMILSGQNWKVGNTGGSEVRDQLSTRIQFKAMSKTQSRLLIESPDAEGLNDLGRAIAVIPGRERIQLQSPLVSRDAIERALSGQRGARQAMPIVDVEPEQTSIADQERERILELGRKGESVTAIMMDVWGSKNGRRARQVRDILDSDGVTG
jgi:DNA segregation ATPase FtsK/SpoIIIE-like protein